MTVSMIYIYIYIKDTFKFKLNLIFVCGQDGWTNHHHIPIVRVDPEGRCAVMLIYGRKLVVLPFRKDPSLDDGDLLDTAKFASSNKTPILSSYMIVLKTLEEKMDNVIDLQFLHGYYEPTLLILYEPVRTFSG